MHISSHRRALAVAAATSGLLVAACGAGGNGEDGKSAQQIVKDAQAALRSISSYHLSGTVDSDGKPVQLDLKVDGPGSASGHISQDGVGFDFITTGGTTWIRGKDFFAHQVSSDVADKIGNKWVTATGNSDLEDATSSFESLTKASDFADSLGSDGGPFSKAGTKTVDGQQVVAVRGKNGELDVALSGKPFPVRLDGGSKGKLDISEYGAHFGVKKPSGALDASDLDLSTPTPEADTTKVVTDATKVRDGVLEIAQASITDSSGSVDDAWGVGALLTKQLPSSIEVSVKSGTLSSDDAASPTEVLLVGEETDHGDVFMVVVQDQGGDCEVGALTGTPPNQHPQKATVPEGTDCTGSNALDALAGSSS